MKAYTPLRDLVYVKKFAEKEKSGIILPDSTSKRFIRLQILDKGPDVKESIFPGDIVLAENMFEPVDEIEKEYGMILSKYIVSVEGNNAN